MTDWQYQNGNLLMMIRDTGGNVEFWVQPDQYTFNNDQPYSYVINGATHSGQAAISASTWTRLGYANVTADQTVSMTVTDTGLGFPTHTFSHFIDRASAPSPPARPILTVRSDTVIELDLGADGANNGAAIDSRQYAGNSVNTVPGSNYRAAVNNYQWTGLAPRTTYYFWERTHNAKGYSGWSPVASAKTWGVPDAPAAPKLSNIADHTMVVAFTDAASNGSAIDDREILYNTAFKTSGPTAVTVKATNSTTISGLLSHTDYYIFVRTHNAYGWSDYSAYTMGTTLGPPEAPTSPTISEITQTTARAVFADNGNGGSPITGHELGWSTNGSPPTTAHTATADLNQVMTGLPPGVLVYFFARSLNVYGASEWSAPKTARTAAGAWVYDAASKTWKPAIPWVNVNGVWKVAKSWAKIAGVWKGTTS